MMRPVIPLFPMHRPAVCCKSWNIKIRILFKSNPTIVMSLRPISLTLLAGMTCALTSCFQATNDNAINADGTGKFTIKTTLDLSALQGVLPGGADADAGAGPGDDMLISVLAGTQGVDVWKEAKSVKGSDGKITVTASGYFKDVTKFKAANPMESMGSGSSGGGGASASGPSLGDIQSTKDADGNWVIEVPMGKAGDKKDDAPAEPAEKLSKEEIADKVTEMRTQFGAMKPMMQAMMGTMKIGQTIKVGGTIKDYGIFTKVDDNTAKMEISFVKIFDGMEKLMADDAVAEKLAQMGGAQANPLEMIGSADPEMKAIGEKMAEAIFGGKGEPKLVIKPGDPVFDYAKESAAAKAGQTAELKALLKKAAEKAAGGGDEEPKEETEAPPVKEVKPSPIKKKAA